MITKTKMHKKKSKEEIINPLFYIHNILKKDSIMVTFVIIALLICCYFAYYSKGYDITIQEHYLTYINTSCQCKGNYPIYSRPNLEQLSLTHNLTIIKGDTS